MATSFKLTYLNYRGRAELIRFILSQAGIEFKDIRLAPEKWDEIRPSEEMQSDIQFADIRTVLSL